MPCKRPHQSSARRIRRPVLAIGASREQGNTVKRIGRRAPGVLAQLNERRQYELLVATSQPTAFGRHQTHDWLSPRNETVGPGFMPHTNLPLSQVPPHVVGQSFMGCGRGHGMRVPAALRFHPGGINGGSIVADDGVHHIRRVCRRRRHRVQCAPAPQTGSHRCRPDGRRNVPALRVHRAPSHDPARWDRKQSHPADRRAHPK